MSTETVLIVAAALLISCATRFLSAVTLRQWLLLSASYLLYAHWAGMWFLLILIGSSLVNYLFGALLRRRPTTGLLWAGIGVNVLLLSFFKYLPPLAQEWTVLAEADFVHRVVLPLGISFWTFQGLSYLFDIYREEEGLDPTFTEFLLYMAFWPTVFSGPVCRLPQMLPQFRQPSAAVSEDFSIGAVRIVQGFFMKFLLAALLGAGLSPNGGVTAGFDEIAPARSGLDVWALAIGYGFQIFFDFAGYSNIVIGVARLMGIYLPENFNRPYLSLTPSVFWTRWHMSLSFWIRDYVFMPLATLGRSPRWLYASLIMSMALFGFWHDAKLTFVVWGVYHGALLVAHRAGQQLKRRVHFSLPHPMGALLSWFSTFLLVSLSYIFFRANDLGQALQMLQAVVAPRSYAFSRATLPHDYYLLVTLIVTGYFMYAGLAQTLLLWNTRYRNILRNKIEVLPSRVLATLSGAVLTVDAAAIERKWWWLTPIFLLLVMITTLNLFGQTSNIAPFIYTLF
jgi:alginate O-acetyltransferase complex protein AlgI